MGCKCLLLVGRSLLECICTCVCVYAFSWREENEKRKKEVEEVGPSRVVVTE